MLSNATDHDHASVLRTASRFRPVDTADFAPILQTLQCRDLAPGESLLHAGQPEPGEYFVLHGLLRISVADEHGREVTLDFPQGPGILPPAMTRMAGGCSRVDCQALEPTRVARFGRELLVTLMLRSPVLQQWGEAVMHAELLRRADREWRLAALPALERLQLLRREHPTLEQRAPHRLVASYLGITPVSLSRLRAQLLRENRPPQPC
ncbi:Crp/Fnr family transcriptional regulator [Acidovorax sp. FJL06]|uniref:Crp/Fnr family transcriptional regulator n=1 Tax=Acidovorax sp. FJL06 TaxID=2153365 RepID=UPI0013152953|nr:Crp/Fnr family transcriptional regulator [Acidovorax sp. FJL06]